MSRFKNKLQLSYRQVMKGTSIFGGVQFINIIILIIKTKVIAFLLGPTGMGIVSLLNSTIALIGGLTNFGLKTSAVKDVAESNQNQNRTNITISVLRKLFFFTGLLVTITLLIFSKTLSNYAFGNDEYTMAFVWLSVTLLFQQLSSGQIVILQGLRKLKLLAKANVLASFIGLLISLPLYYILGIRGIVPAIFLTAFSTLIISWYYSKTVVVDKIKLTFKEIFTNGKEMLSMGFLISLSGLMTLGIAYILRIYISNSGGVDEVGLYSAGFAIINTYVGLIFSALATDYFPRLSSSSKNNKLSIQIVNHQSEIAILIMAPILIFFIIFIDWLILLLFTEDFLVINKMLHWASIGMFFKLASWTVAFLFLAKGKSKLFFWNELVAHTYTLLLNLLGYYYYGITGLGVSFLIAYLLYAIQVYLITKMKFEFSFYIEFIKLFTCQLSLCLLCFLSVNYVNSYLFVGMILLIISSYISIRELDKRLDLKKYSKILLLKLIIMMNLIILH